MRQAVEDLTRRAVGVQFLEEDDAEEDRRGGGGEEAEGQGHEDERRV